MKKIHKRITTIIISLCFGISILSVNAMAADTSMVKDGASTQTAQISESGNHITPYSDIIGWRYKSVDGKVYRRKYNYSKGKWISDWELCE